MEKLKMETADITQKNIEKIEGLFPNVITEMQDQDGKLKKGINFELLKQELSGEVIEGEDCYDFTWVGKKTAIIEGNKSIKKTLRPCMEESKNWEKTKNLYIEGDNLDVLKLLQESYLDDIKLIYIDPPYNTGDDFIYKDNFSIDKDEYEELIGAYDEDNNKLFHNTEMNGRFHSDWCSLMYPRLKLARNLLSKDGVIFISIDDNEVTNLKKICDEVFGPMNFEADFHIKVRHEKRILREDIRYQLCMEHILCYRKDSYTPNRLIKEKNVNDDYRFDIILKEYPTEIKNIAGYNVEIYKMGTWEVIDCGTGKGKFKEYQIRGSLITQKGSASEYYEINLRDRRELDGEGTLYKVIDMGTKGDGLGYRFIRQPNNYSFKNGFYYQGKPLGNSENKGLPYPNFYDFIVESNKVGEEGHVEYKGGKKPVALIEKIMEIAGISNDLNCTVLDFFAGSSTTAHALMNYNQDGGNRKFIMVQLPEDLDKAYEKASAKNKAALKNSITFLDKYNKPHSLAELGKLRIDICGNELLDKVNDVGYRVFKVDSTNMKDIYYSASEYSQEILAGLESNLKDNRTDLDLLYGVLLDWGLPLTYNHKIEEIDGIKVHTIDEGSLVACFTDNITENVIHEIAKRQPLRVVFRDSSFIDSSDKINLMEIFKLYLKCSEDEIKRRVKVI